MSEAKSSTGPAKTMPAKNMPAKNMPAKTAARRQDGAAWAALVLLILLVALGLAWDRLPSGSLPAWAPSLWSAEPDFYLGGIQVHEDSHQRWLDRLEATGFNTVSVTDYAHHGDWDTYNLWFEGDNEGEVKEIRAAKERGFQVVLILRVALDHAFPRNEFLWHGMIQPKTEAELDEWFYRYRSFARWWAETAEREGVDVLMIGSEMNALTSTRPVADLPSLEEWYLNPVKREEQRQRLMEHAAQIEARHLVPPLQQGYEDLGSYLDSRFATERSWAETVAPDVDEVNRRRALLESRWRDLIADVREIYTGPLGYAANFDQYHEVGFWDALDVMGINAYFQLRRHLLPDAEPEDLVPLLRQGWRQVLGGIQSFRDAQGLEGLPVMFTEMGFTYRASSTIEPWASDGFSLVPEAPLEDALAEMRALQQVEAARRRAKREAEAEGRVLAKEELPPLPVSRKRPERLVVWQDQPEEPRERALAVRALYDTLHEMGLQQSDVPFLQGILYWKLSSHPWHWDDEPFVLLIDETSDDPLQAELRRFVR